MYNFTLDWACRQNKDKEMHTEFWWEELRKRSLENPDIRNDVKGLGSLSSGRFVSATLKVQFLLKEKERETQSERKRVPLPRTTVLQYNT
jgi:hypothetical protein